MQAKHSAGGLIFRGNQVLAISWTNSSYIGFPKGGLNKGESSEEAAIREVKEETGYDTRIIEPLGSWSYESRQSFVKYVKTVDYYLLELVNDNPPQPMRELFETFENLWLDIDDAKKLLTYDDARGAFDRALDIRG